MVGATAVIGVAEIACLWSGISWRKLCLYQPYALVDGTLSHCLRVLTATSCGFGSRQLFATSWLGNNNVFLISAKVYRPHFLLRVVRPSTQTEGCALDCKLRVLHHGQYTALINNVLLQVVCVVYCEVVGHVMCSVLGMCIYNPQVWPYGYVSGRYCDS